MSEKIHHLIQRTITTYWTDLQPTVFYTSLLESKTLEFTIKTFELREESFTLSVDGLAPVLEGMGFKQVVADALGLVPTVQAKYNDYQVIVSFNDLISVERKRLLDCWYNCNDGLKDWITSSLEKLPIVHKPSRESGGMDVFGWIGMLLTFLIVHYKIPNLFLTDLPKRFVRTRLKRTPNSSRDVVTCDASFETRFIVLSTWKKESQALTDQDFVNFLKYYQTFPYEKNVISLRRPMDLRSNQTKAFKDHKIVVIDPFLPFRNHARHVALPREIFDELLNGYK